MMCNNFCENQSNVNGTESNKIKSDRCHNLKKRLWIASNLISDSVKKSLSHLICLHHFHLTEGDGPDGAHGRLAAQVEHVRPGVAISLAADLVDVRLAKKKFSDKSMEM